MEASILPCEISCIKRAVEAHVYQNRNEITVVKRWQKTVEMLALACHLLIIHRILSSNYTLVTEIILK